MSISQKHVNTLRDAALLLEKSEIYAARDLMRIAHEARPDGPFIKTKLDSYENHIKFETESAKVLHELLSSGELAIIPAGFRCHTKFNMFDDLGIKQPSMPFDTGFFPPDSIARVLEAGGINLKFPDNQETHTVCVKLEHQKIGAGKRAIKFETSTYKELRNVIQNRKQLGLNKYLDVTMGYYTLDVVNQYVLAHYNWHSFSLDSFSKGITKPRENIPKINVMLNKRIERMMDTCQAAKHVILAVGEFQNYTHMLIDDAEHDLHNFEYLTKVAKGQLNENCLVKNYSEIDTSEKVLALIN